MSSKESKRLGECRECGARCCRHVALEIDTPTCKADYDNIRWYLMHEGVSVFTDDDDDWHVEFAAVCERLQDDFRCGRYEDRPKVCRGYPRKDEYCEYESDQSPYKLFFSKVEEFERYLDRKKIRWRWKRLKD
jgi:Fe-S-cluster containining protein